MTASWMPPGATPQPLLAVRGVSLQPRRGNLFLLQDLNFEVQGGDRLLLLGQSGSGKTLLLRLLNGLLSPSQGDILFQGKPLNQWDAPTLRRQVVWVSEVPRLLGMTVKEAIAYPLQLQKLPALTIQQRLATWTDRLEISTAQLDRTETELSPLEKQRVAIARALVLDPQILLLDEPSDPQLRQTSPFSPAVWEALSQTHPPGLAIVWASRLHGLSLSSYPILFGQRLLGLQRGRLLEDLPRTAPTSIEDWEALQVRLAPPSQQSEAEAEDWDDEDIA